jgi:phage gpG-like protein
VAVVQESLIDISRWAGKAASDLPALDYTPALKQARLLLISDMKENFAGQHSPDGTGWAPLAFPRVRGGGQVLRDRGLLMASLSGGQGHVDEMTTVSLTLGTNLEYAAVHQYGATITPKGHPFLAIPRTVEAMRAGSPRRMPGLSGRLGGRGGVFVDSGGQVQFILARQVVIPARPFVGISAQANENVGHIFGDFVTKRLSA